MRFLIFLVVLSTLLTACTSSQPLEEAHLASEEGRALFSVKGGGIYYEAMPSAIPPDMTSEAFEAQQWPILESECLRPRNYNFMLLINEIASAARYDKMRALTYGVEQSRKIEDSFADCGRALGLNARTIEILKDGRQMNFTSMLQSAIPILEHRDRALSTFQRNQFWENFAIALAAFSAGYAQTSPSQIWIAPYTRPDGTLVNSHWRTLPNATCIDNIRGCR